MHHKDERDLLDVLKFERDFLEKGGYGRSAGRPRLVFEDSPTCLNYGSAKNQAPCSDCVLMALVPPEGVYARIPCRHIRFNAEGETLDTLYGHEVQFETEEVVDKWLHQVVAKLEAAREKSRRDVTVRPAQVE